MLTLDLLKSRNAEEIKKQIDNIDLSRFVQLINNKEYKEYMVYDAGAAHYKLLAALSFLFQDQTIYDIGTHYGLSSLALSLNPSNKVISYDIVEKKQLKSIPPNIEYKFGDFRLDDGILNSPLIVIDVDPHDGIQEAAFHKFFVENNYKGIVIWDDIHLNVGMKNFWGSVRHEKYDLSIAGNSWGTGITFY